MRLFPRLRAGSFQITSRPTPLYNCIAFAAGVVDEWWEYRRGYTWPNAGRNPSLDEAIELFAGLGFAVCDNDLPETHWEKIAIYGDHAGYTHAARQLESGRWLSKLGKLQNIEHKRLVDLTGGDYGDVKQIMRRRRPVKSVG